MSAQEDQEPVEIELIQEQEVPDTLPVMPLKDFVLFPRTVAPLVITTDESKALVGELSERTPHFIAVLQRSEGFDEARMTREDVHRVGCVARMIKTLHFPDGSTHVLVEGLSRCEMQHLNTKGAYPMARYRMSLQYGQSATAVRPDRHQPSHTGQRPAEAAGRQPSATPPESPDGIPKPRIPDPEDRQPH
jgi:ATP-dependent Lon protease